MVNCNFTYHNFVCCRNAQKLSFNVTKGLMTSNEKAQTCNCFDSSLPNRSKNDGEGEIKKCVNMSQFDPALFIKLLVPLGQLLLWHS